VQKSFDISLEPLLNKIAGDLNFSVVKIQSVSTNKNHVEILIERFDQNSISITDCKLYNIKLREYDNDLQKIFGGEYYFDISSAGVERPLVKIQDYERFKNNVILIRFKDKIDKKKKIQGTLIGLENNKIKIRCNGKDLLINYDNISNANIVMTEEIFRELLSKQGSHHE
jgi:ribosome maturation factor RimP